MSKHNIWKHNGNAIIFEKVRRFLWIVITTFWKV